MEIWLSVCAALSVYLLTVFGLRSFIIRNAALLDREQFNQACPTRQWLLILHELLCLPAFLAGLIGGPVVAMLWCEETQVYSCGAWLAVSLWNLFNGLFELATGIHPSYGLVLKRYSSQRFVLSGDVKKLGLVRIALSGIIWIGIWTMVK